MMITVPKELKISAVHNVVEFCGSILNNDNIYIQCDASKIRFVDPIGMCVVAATCHQAKKIGKEINIINLDKDVESYLQRMKFFENCYIDNIDDKSRNDLSDRLFEVYRLENINQVEEVCSKLTNAALGKIGYEEDEIDEMTGFKPSEQVEHHLKYSLSELLDNSLTHARGRGYINSCAWVSSQYFPKTDSIRLAVVDTGCGFLRSLELNPKLEDKTDNSAIRCALLPRISANRGVGLTIVKDLALASNGIISILSGSGLIKVNEYREFGQSLGHLWQGSIVCIEFKRSKMNRY